MTKKLYYQDAYLTQFATEVVRDGEEEGKPFVVLRETAFYPSGGGQPSDTGTINGIYVSGTEEKEGEIRHYLDYPLPEGTRQAAGAIDWMRRFDHMQQHSGQHILSASFEELYGFKTVSFHLGKETATIDLDVADIEASHIAKAETRANGIVMESRPIETVWVTAEEAEKYPLRKDLSVDSDIRLVIIPDFDYNGCGGTHPAKTSETGAIKILGWERTKKKVRVTFICGNRVLKRIEEEHAIISGMKTLLNAPEELLFSAANRLVEEGKHLSRELEAAKEELLHYEAKRLAASKGNPIISIYEGRSVKELQKLSRMVVADMDSAQVILVSQNGNQLQFVCAQGNAGAGDMKKLAGDVLPAINGKGGGSKNFAQGGGEALMSAKKLAQLLETKAASSS